MAQRGFSQYDPPPVSSTVPVGASAPFYMPSTSTAQQRGFHLSPQQQAAQRQLTSANSRLEAYLATISMAKQQAFSLALFGNDSSRRQLRVGPELINYPTTGCIAEAAAEVKGDPVRYLTYQADMTQLYDRARYMAMQDSRFKAAVRNWARCMTRRGYHYADPGLASSEAMSHGPTPSEGEIKVAIADSQCATKVGLLGTWKLVDSDAQRSVAATHKQTVVAWGQRLAAEAHADSKILK